MADHNVNHNVDKWLTISSDDDFLLDLQREDYSILFIHIKFHKRRLLYIAICFTFDCETNFQRNLKKNFPIDKVGHDHWRIIP